MRGLVLSPFYRWQSQGPKFNDFARSHHNGFQACRLRAQALDSVLRRHRERIGSKIRGQSRSSDCPWKELVWVILNPVTS